jgi:hypothetical protein
LGGCGTCHSGRACLLGGGGDCSKCRRTEERSHLPRDSAYGQSVVAKHHLRARPASGTRTSAAGRGDLFDAQRSESAAVGAEACSERTERELLANGETSKARDDIAQPARYGATLDAERPADDLTPSAQDTRRRIASAAAATANPTTPQARNRGRADGVMGCLSRMARSLRCQCW